MKRGKRGAGAVPRVHIVVSDALPGGPRVLGVTLRRVSDGSIVSVTVPREEDAPLGGEERMQNAEEESL